VIEASLIETDEWPGFERSLVIGSPDEALLEPLAHLRRVAR
jgi:hypothetical protein